jgi:tape measure domain-containing protein
VAQQAKIEIVIDDRQAQRALGNLTNALASLGAINFVSGLAAQFLEIASSAQEMTNKLIFATGSIENANVTFDALAATAQRTGSNLGGTVDLFSKLAQSSTFAGSSTASLAFITEQFNKTLQISGASGAGAASALYQFAQAVQKGTLNGDEFRTIMETNGYLLKILEEQTGKTRTELIAMASDGRLSAEIVGRALLETTKISEDYGKVVRTLPQSMENFRTSVTKAVKALDDKLKITAGIGKALDLMAKNTGVVIGAIGGLTVAVVGLLAVLIPAATLMAVVTGGAAVLGAVALGGALGYVAQQAGLFGKESEKAAESQAAIQSEAQKGLVVSKQRNIQALDLDKTLRQTIDQLRAQNDLESQGTGIKSLQLEVEKAVAKEREKYKKTGEAIDQQLEKELALETRKKILIDESLSTKRKLLELESSIGVAAMADAGQRQVAQQLESYRLSVTKETYEIYKDQLRVKIQENIQQRALSEYSDRLKESQIEITNLNIRDLNVREQQTAVDRERLRLGSLFTAEMEAQVRANVRNAQLAREMAASEAQRSLVAGTARNQSTAQQIETATGALSRLDPRLAIEQQYQTEKAALANSEILNEQQKYDALSKLDNEYARKKNDVTIAMFEQQLKASGVVNTEIINVAKTTMAQAQMVTQGGIVGIQGALGMLGGFLEQAGKNNKKAFEAQKAVAIAQTIISTYQAATQAFAAMSLIPFVGPALGFAAAATIVAAGLANVAAIRSQQYQGRQLGGPVMGGQSYIVGENGPEVFTPNTTGSITRNGDLGKSDPVQVNFTIVANDTTGFDELLQSRQGVIKQIISDAMLERGQRSMV